MFDADGKVVYEPKTEEAVKVPFLVKVSISDLNIRRGPGTDYGRVQFCPVGVYANFSQRIYHEPEKCTESSHNLKDRITGGI